jgi:YbbR domain-containing protein
MRKLLELIFGNFDLKVAAMVLAAITWYYLVTGGLIEREFQNVGIQVSNLPPDVAVLSIDTQELALTLKGPRADLDRLEGRSLVVEIDLANTSLDAGSRLDRIVRIGDASTRLLLDGEPGARIPRPIDLVEAKPEAVKLTLNTVIERELPVEVATEGRPSPGFELKVTAIPPRLKVRGPFLLLQNLASLATEPVRIDGLKESVNRTVRVVSKVASKEFGLVDITPESATVTVSLAVGRKPEEKTLPGVPIRLANVPETLAILKQDVDAVTVTLKGPENFLRDLDAQNLVAVIDLKDQQPPAEGTDEVTCHLLAQDVRQVGALGNTLLLPNDVERQAEPRVVRFTVDRIASRSLPVRAALDGEPETDYEVSEAAAFPKEVTVRGPKTVIDRLEAIETLPVSVAGLKENFRRKAALPETVDAGDLGAVRIEATPPTVDVVVTVDERRLRKTLDRLPVRVLLPPNAVAKIRVESDPVTVGPVDFVGPASVMEQFGPDSVVAFVRVDVGAGEVLRPTIKNVEFHVQDPRIERADGKAITVRIEFLSSERPNAPPKPEKP